MQYLAPKGENKSKSKSKNKNKNKNKNNSIHISTATQLGQQASLPLNRLRYIYNQRLKTPMHKNDTCQMKPAFRRCVPNQLLSSNTNGDEPLAFGSLSDVRHYAKSQRRSITALAFNLQLMRNNNATFRWQSFRFSGDGARHDDC